ncbi:ABC transporter permease, partial [candidate division KSB1 bacterium]
MSLNKTKPPKFREKLLERFLDPATQYSAIGDFSEMFNYNAENKGTLYAKCWYWIQVLKAFVSYTKNNILWSMTMFKNYMIIALRNIRKQKSFSIINISGLAIGLASCIIILLYVLSELSYDKFNKNADNIYRLGMHAVMGGNEINTPLSNPPSALALVRNYPEVINAVRLYPIASNTVKYEDKLFYENRIVFADNSLFDLFTLPFISGDPETALLTRYTAVISEDIATKYFEQEDPIGKVLKLNNVDNYTVTGVIKNLPENSHFTFDIFCSFETLYEKQEQRIHMWMNFNYYTYLLLQNDFDYKQLQEKLPAFSEKYMGESKKMIGAQLDLFLQPLTDIHLHSHLRGELSVNSDISYVYIFSAIAGFILLIA